MKCMDRLDDKVLYVICGKIFYKITRPDWKEVSELMSTQEEADTRMLLHAKPSAQGGSKE